MRAGVFGPQLASEKIEKARSLRGLRSVSSFSGCEDRASQLREAHVMKGKTVRAKRASTDKISVRVSALRSVLRSAPPKDQSRSRSPLRAAVLQLLPDLLAFRAKGYSDAELADVMQDNGFFIAASTLKTYIGEARAGAAKVGKRPPAKAGKKTTAKTRKKKTASAGARSAPITVKSGSRGRNTQKKTPTPPSLLATKPLMQNGRTAKDVLGHRFDDDV
jgi:hypothetical protein